MNDTIIHVFYSYCRKDEPLRVELAKHLAPLRHEGVILDWADRDIDAGDDWHHRIEERLDHADLVLLMVSPDFLASEYCYGKEMARAMEHHRSGKVSVVPILLRPIDWGSVPFYHLKPLPKNRMAITSWQNRDEAFASVAREIRKVAKAMRRKKEGRLSAFEWMKKSFRLLGGGAAKPEQDNTSFGPLQLLISCPTCGKPYYVTVELAGAQYRCRSCNCVEIVPNEWAMLFVAVAQQKISRATLVKVAIRKLASQDLPLTSPLLLRERKGEQGFAEELLNKDVVKKPRVLGAADETNSLAAFRQAGQLAQIEINLAEAMQQDPIITDNLISMGISDTQKLAEVGNVVADTIISMAAEGRSDSGDIDKCIADAARHRPETKVTATSPFQWSRILCLYCMADEAFGKQLLGHLETLKQGKVIDRVAGAVVHSESTFLRSCKELELLLDAYHVVVLLVSPSMISTDLCREGGIDVLVDYNARNDLVLIPVIVQPMAWQRTNLRQLQVLPEGGSPLSTWSSLDEACANVVDGIGKAIGNLSAETIVKVAARSDADAMWCLSLAYALGAGVKRNPEKMLYWMEKAAKLGEEPGVMWLYAYTVQKRNPSDAVEWMLKAAEAGSDMAMRELAYWYGNGAVVPQDDRKAFEWSLRGALLGQKDCILEVARRYFQGLGTPSDEAKGTEWLARGAEKGIPVAMVHLGNSYSLGRGVPKDLDTAGEWWRKAADTEDKEALEILKSQGYPC